MAHVEIVDPDPTWPAQFEVLAEQLHEVLGDLALHIDHIGSTAVAGLSAKDVIDVQVTVADDGTLADAVTRLADAGFVVRPGSVDHPVPGAPPGAAEWTKGFVTQRPGQRRAHVHVRVAGRANQRYPLLFRDFLRAHPDTAAAYEAFKWRAAELVPESSDVYADLKDPVCDLVYLPAEEWAARTGWTPSG